MHSQFQCFAIREFMNETTNDYYEKNLVQLITWI